MKTRRKIGQRQSKDRDRDRSSVPREIRTSNRRDSSRSFNRRSYSRDRSRVSGLYLRDEVDSTGEPEFTLDEQMERVNINSVQSVKDFCLDGIDDYYSISKTDRSMFTNAVVAVAKDLNRFDVKKHKCALYGGSGHNFDNCPEVLKASGDLKSAYIRLRLLVNKLMSGFYKLYPLSKNLNDIHNTPVSAITTALSTEVSSDNLQGINQLLQQQQ